MANYSLVRGWIECAFEDVDRIKEKANAHWQAAADYAIDQSVADLYWKGWCFPHAPMNWTSLVFYGGNVRSAAVPFLKECFLKLSSSGLDICGTFYVDDEESSRSCVWVLSEGGITEKSRDFCG